MSNKSPCPRCGSLIFFRGTFCEQCGYIRTSAAQLISTVIQVERVDTTALFNWILPRRDELNIEFLSTGWPSEDRDIWLRKRYLAEHTEQPSPALRNTPSTAFDAINQADEPAAGSVFIKYMYSLARRVLL